jgi:predicted dehydrogenase
MMYAKPLLKDFAGVAELVGVCDTNPKRIAGSLAWLGTDLPAFTDFDEMLRKARPDCVIIASRDCTHADYVVRALDAGKRVYVEKPLCTTAAQARDILAAVKRTGGVCLTTHNLRYDLPCISVRSLLQQGRAGRVRFVVMEDTLDRSHGADYFRRWHRKKANTGGLQIHKSSHHFDLLNWWIGSKPVRVSAEGGLKFYGRNNPYRGRCCRGCAQAKRCPFFVDYTSIEIYRKLYFEAEEVDGYLRDGCVFDPEIDIEDQFAAHIVYENGVEVSYTLVAYAPTEGIRISIDGTLGRVEHVTGLAAGLLPGLEKPANERQRLIPADAPVMEIPLTRPEGDHGGADPLLRKDFIGRDWDLAPNAQMASVEEAAQAVLIGAAINKSLATGRAVNVQELLERD